MKAAAALRLLRPHQWVKNGFVLVGLLFGHAGNDPQKVAAALSAFAAFCLLSSAVYVMNDLRDREEDRRHPAKRGRPLASGALGLPEAVVLMFACAGGGLWLAFAHSGEPGIYLAYLGLNIGYSFGLKHVVILDVFLIAAGFMLRLLAGTLGIGIAPSHWLLLCGLMVTLFLGFAKRHAELSALAGAGAGAPGEHRPVLDQYTLPLLDKMITVAAAGTLVSYSLYTVAEDTVALHGTADLIYTVPFVVYGLFRYLFLLHRRGGGGDPAQELLRDPHLAGALAGWLAVTLWLLRG